MFIEEDDDRKQQFRCQVVREQPFRSTSSDVSQVTDRCNVDYQFLPCAPPLPPDTEDSDVVQLAVDSALAMPASDSATTQQGDAPQSAARRRVRTKTRFGATKADAINPNKAENHMEAIVFERLCLLIANSNDSKNPRKSTATISSSALFSIPGKCTKGWSLIIHEM